MNIGRRDDEYEIPKKITEEFTNQINQYILENINKFLNYNSWQDKFEIRIVGDNVMPYKVQHFIHSLIEEDLHKGKITRDDEHYKYEISLDDIHKVTYIYDAMFDKDKIIRYHQTEEEYKRLHEPFNISNELNKYTSGLYLDSSKYIIRFDLI